MDRSGWDAASWVDQELAGSTFKDERLGRRLRKLLVQMAGAVGAPIPLAGTVNLLAEGREEQGCSPSYAAAATSVISAQIAKARARALRYSAAVT